MGMAASQARFLGLTARKTNVEYEGQQINQQRTTLSNQTANYYNQLLGMSVPTPPSVADFTKTVYTFSDGSITNSITSLIAQNNGLYKASYVSSYAQDFSIVSAGKTSVVNSQAALSTFALRAVVPTDNNYYVGADKLKQLEEDLHWAYVIREGSQTYRLYEDGVNYTYTNANGEAKTLIPATQEIIENIIGPKPKIEDYNVGPLIDDYTSTGCYSDVIKTTGNTRSFHMEHNLCRLIWTDGRTSITSSNGVTLTRKSTTQPSKYSLAGFGSGNVFDQTSSDLQKALSTYYPDLYQQIIDMYIENLYYYQKTSSYYTFSNADSLDGNVSIDDLYSRWQTMWPTLHNIDYAEAYEKDLAAWETEAAPYVGNYLDANDYTKIYTFNERQMYYDGESEYLKSLSSDQLIALYEDEVNTRDRLNQLYGESENGWYVRYVQNTTSGEYEPIYYNGDDMANGVRLENGDICSSVATYKIGTKDICQEVKSRTARLEKDSTGRYIGITLYEDKDGTVNPITYKLTMNTLTDQDAYDDAMNQYEYDKYQYDQAIQEINAKIEIIQAQDKNLELRLKQLDTEQDAITTEMDAVQKVIEKNTESTFKTFG